MGLHMTEHGPAVKPSLKLRHASCLRMSDTKADANTCTQTEENTHTCPLSCISLDVWKKKIWIYCEQVDVPSSGMPSGGTDVADVTFSKIYLFCHLAQWKNTLSQLHVEFHSCLTGTKPTWQLPYSILRSVFLLQPLVKSRFSDCTQRKQDTFCNVGMQCFSNCWSWCVDIYIYIGDTYNTLRHLNTETRRLVPGCLNRHRERKGKDAALQS